MRSSLSVRTVMWSFALILALLAFLASAAPVVLPSTADLSTSVTSSTNARPDLEDQIRQSTNSAKIVLPCRGCLADDSDAFFAVNFSSGLLPTTGCNPTEIYLQGNSVVLRDADDTIITHDVVDGHRLALQTVLHCALKPGNTHWTPTIEVTLSSVDLRSPTEVVGFTISIEPSASPVFVTQTLFQIVQEGELHVPVNIVHPSNRTTHDDATALLLAVERTRQSLRLIQPARTTHEITPTGQNSAFSGALREQPATSQISFCNRLLDAFGRLFDRARTAMAKEGAMLFGHQSPMTMTSSELIPNETGLGLFEGPPAYTSIDPSPPSYADSFWRQGNPVIKALEALATLLGLGGLLALIRRRCGSLRRRVDRLADREERRTARQYRRAARRESLRRKWQIVSCVFRRSSRGMSGEKQAMLSEAAEEGRQEDFSIEDEKAGDAITSLRYAHEIVAAMVGSGIAANARNSSTSFVPQDVRSRSSSLPSYKLDAPPDYASLPDGETARMREYKSSSVNGSIGSSAATPDSSIPDLSPRCSGETLRSEYSGL